MTRTVKEAEVRRQEILDTAQLLYMRDGYDETSVQDIVDEIGIAKGTFYHYFDSKESLLIALIESLFDDIVANMDALVQDERLSGSQKLNAVFSGSTEIKLAYKPTLTPLVSAFLNAESAVIREKAGAETVRRIGPPLGQIISQGVGEGAFTVDNPPLVAQIILQLAQGMGYAIMAHFDFTEAPNSGTKAKIEPILAGYQEAIARVLGAAPGSIKLVDSDVYDRWFEG